MPGRASSGSAELKKRLKQAESRVFKTKYGRSGTARQQKQPAAKSFLLDKFERPQKKAAFIFVPTRDEPMRNRRRGGSSGAAEGSEDEVDDGGGHVQRIIKTYTVAPEPVLKLGQRMEHTRLVLVLKHASVCILNY
jgi:hypothetical protein